MDFFEKNKDQLAGFMDEINVNRDKTLIKYGYVENEGLSVAFYIHNELDPSITAYTEKINCLFNTDNKAIREIENQLNADKPFKVSFSPFLKINDSPLIHAFQMNIKYLV